VRSHGALSEAPMSNVGWSEDRVTTLSKLWLEGLSASQVASQLGGVTRNAVIGKVHRLGLADRGVASPPTRARRLSGRPRLQVAGRRSQERWVQLLRRPDRRTLLWRPWTHRHQARKEGLSPRPRSGRAVGSRGPHLIAPSLSIGPGPLPYSVSRTKPRRSQIGSAYLSCPSPRRRAHGRRGPAPAGDVRADPRSLGRTRVSKH
jgi:hypothetical protein